MTRARQTSDLLAAEESQAKGHFLYLLEQEVRITLWFFRHRGASGRTLPAVAPEAPMVSRQYPDKRKHCSVTSTNTVRPLVELYGTCYSVSNTIIWAKAKNKKRRIFDEFTHDTVISWPKIQIYFKTCIAQFLHLMGITLKYVQNNNSKQNVGYYKTAVSVNRCFLLLYKTKKKYISEK